LCAWYAQQLAGEMELRPLKEGKIKIKGVQRD